MKVERGIIYFKDHVKVDVSTNYRVMQLEDDGGVELKA